MFGCTIGRDVVNIGRQKELDWAKAFTIIVMVIIHTYEQLSVIDAEEIPTDLFRIILEFLAGPLGAPVFMFAMGVGIVYSKNNQPTKMTRRGLLLVRNGYLLNFFKGTVPVLIAMAIGVTAPITIVGSLFNVSILQFAGMAFLTIALMKRRRVSLPVMFIIAIVLSIAGAMLAKIDMSSSWLQYFFGLFFMTNDITTFPLFLWLYYPLLGMAFANVLRRVTDKGSFYFRILLTGITGTILVSVIYIFAGIDIKTMFMLSDRVFYAQTILHYIFTTFVIMIALPIYYGCSKYIRFAPIEKMVAYLGNNLPTIYIVQWIVIHYVQGIMTTLGIPWFEKPMIIPAGLVIVVVSVSITALWRKIRIGK